jgi:hypothetical protein
MESSLFSLIAEPGEKIANTFGLTIAYGGILGSIVAAYFVSWWLLILIPVMFILGSRMMKNSYNTAILRTAAGSELLFCFLFFSGQVSVDVPSTGDHYFYKQE